MAQQDVTGFQRRFDVFALFGVQLVVMQQVDGGEDAVQRRAHLVAHHREETRFFLIGIQRLVAGADDLLLFLQFVGDVADIGDENRRVV